MMARLAPALAPALTLALTLAAPAAAGEADLRVAQILDGWDAGDPGQLRFAIASDPVVESLMVWDAEGARRFPPPDLPLHVSEEAMVADAARLDALRASSTEASAAWERVARGGDSFYRCEPLRCARINGPELALALDLPAAHDFAAPDRRAPLWLPALALALIALAALALRRRRPRGASASRSDPAAFAFGPVTVNPGLMTLADAEGQRPLTERDLKLLRAFSERPGFVLSKDALYDAGWGRDFMPNSRALDQHILTLRRKIDPGQSGPEVIETVRGQGYRFTG